MKKTKNKTLLGIFLVLTAGIMWGHTGFFVRKLEARNVNSIEISVMRLVFTFVIMLLAVVIIDRGSLKIEARYIWYFIGAGGCGMIGSSVFYFYAISMSSLSVAAVLMYTAPAIVVILSVFIFKQKLTFRRVLCCLISFAGAALSSGIIGGMKNISLIGIIYGLAAGLSYALYSVFSSMAIGDGANPISVTVYSFGFAALGILFCGNPLTLVSKIAADPSIGGIAVGQAVLTCLAPYVVYTIGLNYVDAAKASIMSTIELVVASIVGLVWFKEPIGLQSLTGMMLVIASIVILNVKVKEKNKKST